MTGPTAQPWHQATGYLALDDFEVAARRRLPRPLFGYVAGAAETNASRHDNQVSFQDYALAPRILTDVSGRTAQTMLFGHTYSAPFGIAPMGLAALMAYRGDNALAAAARDANIPMILSGTSLVPLEEVVGVNAAAWFQAYLPGDDEPIKALIERVKRAQFGTLVLTVDTAVVASRENNIRNGFTTPIRPSVRLALDGLVRPRWLVETAAKTVLRHGLPHFENSFAQRGAPILSRNVVRDFGRRAHLNWRHVELIRKMWPGAFVLKGILRAEDAVTARDAGIDGIIVSNHGGRQLDGAVAPLRALPQIVAAVGDRMVLMMDSGVRRGTDVLKALGLGAKFVFVGRPFLFAASVGGEKAVRHAIALLQAEIECDMALLGINRPEEMSREFLVARPSGR